MNTQFSVDLHKEKSFWRSFHCFVGVMALVASGWLFDLRSTWAQTRENQIFALDIRSGHVVADKRTIRVTQDDWVELRWTANEAVELHLHGYNIRFDIKRDEPGTMIFEASIAGRFPVGIHGAGGHGNVVYLEVLPH